MLTLQDSLEALLPGSSEWRQSMADWTAKPSWFWFEGSFVYLIFAGAGRRSIPSGFGCIQQHH